MAERKNVRGRTPAFRSQLISFKREAKVGDMRTINIKNRFRTQDSIRSNVNLLFDVLRPIRNERFAIALSDGSEYVINNRTRERIINLIQGELREIEVEGSDRPLFYQLLKTNTLTLIRLPDYAPIRERKGGAFFKYLNKTDLDLTRQGVFKSKDDRMNESCLLYALKMGGISNSKLDSIKQLIRCNKIPICKLQNICDHVNIKIKLKQISNGIRANKSVMTYGESDEEYKIGLIDEHYFLIEKIPITEYALKNHSNDVSKFDVYRENGWKDKKRHIDSYKAISIMISDKDKYLTDFNVNDIIETVYTDIVDEYSSLEYSDKDVRQIADNSNPRDYDKIIYLDFETDTSNGLHLPYLCHYVDSVLDTEYKFIGSNCALDMLNSLSCDTMIYAHNAGYDFKFILGYLMNIRVVMRGSGLICCTAKYFNRKTNKTISLYIKDSYKIVSSPLRNFGKMFSLEQEKELLPYSFYTTANIDTRYHDFNYICENSLELKTDEKRHQFLSNCKKWGVIDDSNSVDIIEYSSKYCRMDCVVLRNGLSIFRGWMLEVTQIDIHHCVSIPQLVHRYFVRQGVYDDVYEMSSIPRHFIQQCVVGGRCMVANNQKIDVKDKVINDFDAVSLYPSGMVRLGEIGGFLKGKPKILTELDYKFLQQQDGYFVKIHITNVGKGYSFPLMTYKNKDGIRLFTNDMIGKCIFVDKITLEDLIEFHKIEFDIIQGYYYNKGRNKRILEIVKMLFDERLKKKKEKNPIESIYKLILNSSYGKTLLKPIDSDKQVLDSKDDMYDYINRKYDYVKEVIPLSYNNQKYVVNTEKPINIHFNACQVGIEILSMSKRIMNEVMCLAEDSKLTIYYQDTDSIHIDDTDIQILQKVYKDKYGRELIGKNMGQFHSDFDLSGCSNIVSKRFIGLGKKSYIDMLCGIDENGLEKIGYHIRLKGIPSSTIDYQIAKDFDNDPIKLYESLYNGNVVKFDLLEGGNRCRFNNTPSLGVETITEFYREVSF